MSIPVIQIEEVSKQFLIPHNRLDTLRDHFIHIFRPKTYEVFQAVDNVSFHVNRGEFLGIIGPNGSGKSTLLKIIAGILHRDHGRVVVQGSIAPFLELGVGFQPELSGRENVFLYASLLGLSREKIKRKYEDIVAFAELERFMDQKLKNYSSGMQVRLAFAVLTETDSDVYLIDEVLAVGDFLFQKKCFNFFRQLKERGKTIVFVSHDFRAVQEFCDRIIIMEKGKAAEVLDTEKAIRVYQRSHYQRLVERSEPESRSVSFKVAFPNQLHCGQKATVTIHYNFKIEVKNPVFQVQIYTLDGTLCNKESNERHRFILGNAKGAGSISLVYHNFNLLEGEYLLMARVWSEGFFGDPLYEIPYPQPFSVSSEVEDGGGICYMNTEWRIDNNL